MSHLHERVLTRVCLSILLGCAALLSFRVEALTLEQLKNDPKLTPQRFASYFKDFKYEFHEDVQDPESFLATRSGDCDDYAILAATVLAEKGYTPRLITVRMRQEIHVVCYIEEIQGYLDYNNRACLIKIASSGGSLLEIAKKVAKSFDSTWTSVSEFTFSNGAKHMVETLVNPETRRKTGDFARAESGK